MIAAYAGKEFDALKLRYEDQVALLRYLTEVDFKIFTAFFTLQLAFGGFMASNSTLVQGAAIGLALIDVTLAGLSVKLLYNNHIRRQQVAATIDNLNEALGFKSPGVYLQALPLNPPYPRHPWFPWYFLGVVIATIGVLMVLFSREVTCPLPL